MYVNQNTVGEYQCVAWFGASALASIPARLTLAAISLENSKIFATYTFSLWIVAQIYSVTETTVDSSSENGTMANRIQPAQLVHWKVHPGNSILIKCGDVVSNPPPAWSFFK